MSGPIVQGALRLPMATGRRRAKRAARPKRATQGYVGVAFCLPLIIGLAAFTVFPIAASMVMSLTNYDGFSRPSYIGASNYAEVATDARVWLSIWNTVAFGLFAIPLGNIVGLFLALLLNLSVRGQAFYRTMFFLPTIVPMIATTVLWGQILNPQAGLINEFLRWMGLPEAYVPGWLTSEVWSKPGLVLMSVWGCGAGMVLYLAALQDVPAELHESASIDGARAWHRLIHITLPMISPVLLFNVVMGLIGVWQYFAQPMVMTGGGPWDSTLVYSLNLFNTAFTEYRWGYASAMAWVVFVIILLSTLAVFRLSKQFVYYHS